MKHRPHTWRDSWPARHWARRRSEPAAQELRAQRQGCEWTGDSAGLTRAIGSAADRRFRFPYGANVYASRISDFYWWHNHRPLPTWYAFWEVNAILTRSQIDIRARARSELLVQEFVPEVDCRWRSFLTQRETHL